MSDFTKEQLIVRAKMRLAMVAGFPDSQLAQMDKCLAEIALATLEVENAEQKPVLSQATLVKPETPATDAWQREQMAKGVDAFANAASDKASSCALRVHVGYWRHAKESAQDFAAQLRNGEAV